MLSWSFFGHCPVIQSLVTMTWGASGVPTGSNGSGCGSTTVSRSWNSGDSNMAYICNGEVCPPVANCTRSRPPCWAAPAVGTAMGSTAAASAEPAVEPRK